MPLDSIPSWIKPASFQAGQEGFEAGLGAARVQQAATEHAAQLQMEAQRLKQSADTENARLSQAEQMAQMEAQARKEISNQNFQRQQQQDLIKQAEFSAKLGLSRDKLDQDNALAQQKAKESAYRFSQGQGAAAYLKEHPGDTAGAFMNFPGALGIPGIANALKPTEKLGDPEVQDIPGVGRVVKVPGSKDWRLVQNPKDKIIRDPKDGSVIAIKPDNTTQVIVPPKVSKSDDVLGAAAGDAVPTPSLLERAASLIGIKNQTPPRSSNASPFKEGQQIRNKKDGKMYVIKNGVPVPVDEQKPSAPESATSHDEMQDDEEE